MSDITEQIARVFYGEYRLATTQGRKAIMHVVSALDRTLPGIREQFDTARAQEGTLVHAIVQDLVTENQRSELEGRSALYNSARALDYLFPGVFAAFRETTAPNA